MVKAASVLAEDPASVPSTQAVAHDHQSRSSDPLSVLFGQSAHAHMEANAHAHRIKIKKLKTGVPCVFPIRTKPVKPGGYKKELLCTIIYYHKRPLE